MTANTETQYGSRVIASDRSNYWRYYGLHRDPFLPIVEDSNFFLPVRWEQYFDLLQYLCESTNVLLSVTGVKGSGKTTFMRQFIAQTNDNTRICRLVGSTVLTADQLSKTLIKDFSLPKPTGENTEEQWESLCHAMQSSSQPYLLVIDDAHRLPHETLSAILNLIKQQSEHQMRLHILLIGETQLSNMLNSLAEGENDRELVHTISLEALNLQDTEAYIKHRLIAAGLPGGLPLRSTDITRIYRLSEGVPGRINAVARQVLIDVMQQRQAYGLAQFIRTRRNQLLGGSVLLIILIGLAFILTHGHNDSAFRLYKFIFSQKVAPIANSSSQTSTEKTVVLPTAIIGKDNTSTATATMSNVVAPTSSTNTNTVQAKTKINSTVSAPTNLPITETDNINNTNTQAKNNQWYEASMVTFKNKSANTNNNIESKTPVTVENKSIQPISATKSTTSSIASAPITQERAESTLMKSAMITSKPKLETISVTKTAIPATTGSIANTQAKAAETATRTISGASANNMNSAQATSTPAILLTLDSPLLSNPSHYTLQLVGASSEAAVNKFINKNGLNEQAYYYKTNFRGKNWYVVVYGDYANRQAAQSALADLPAGAREIKPWPRTMKSVTESISHNLNHQATTTQTGINPAVSSAENSAELRKLTTTQVKASGITTKSTKDDTIEIPMID